MHRKLAGCITFMTLVCLCEPASATAKRLALVIGNGAYETATTLRNPKNDAKLMASVLRAVGFQVEEHFNLSFKKMRRAVRSFGSLVSDSKNETIIIIFYAGHGLQLNGENYLVPIDARIETESDIEFEAYPLTTLVRNLKRVKNSTNIIILDACRNNPFRSRLRGLEKGLAPLDAPSGTLVAFSTAPGRVAEDGVKRNSPYTASLSEELLNKNITIETAFKNVRKSVYQKTRGRQVPWEASSIFKDIFLVGGAGKPSKNKSIGMSFDVATKAWDATKDSGSPAVMRSFVEQFGHTIYGPLARARLAELSRESPTDKREPVRSEVNHRVAPSSRATKAVQTRSLVLLSTSHTDELEKFVKGFQGGKYSFSHRANGWRVARQFGFGRRFSSIYERIKIDAKIILEKNGKLHYTDVGKISRRALKEERSIDKIIKGRGEKFATALFLRALQHGQINFPNPGRNPPSASEKFDELQRTYPAAQLSNGREWFVRAYDRLILKSANFLRAENKLSINNVIYFLKDDILTLH